MEGGQTVQGKTWIMSLSFSIFLLINCGFALPWATPLERGNRLYRQDQYEAALEEYNQALANHGNRPEVNYNAGNAAYKSGDYVSAISRFMEAVNNSHEISDEQRSQIHYNLGNAYFRQAARQQQQDPARAVELYKESLRHFRQAIELNRDDIDAKFNYEVVDRTLRQMEQALQQQAQKEGKSQQQKDDQAGEENEEDTDQESRNQERTATSNEYIRPNSSPDEEVEKDSQQIPEKQSSDQKQRPEADIPGTGVNRDRATAEMTKTEALRLLDSLEETGPPWLVPQVPGNPVEKDW